MNDSKTSKKSFFKSFLKIILFMSGLAIAGFIITLCVILIYQPQTQLSKPVALTVIPGAGITSDGLPSTALMLRLDKGINLHQDELSDSFFISGDRDEVRIMRNYLEGQGIEMERIIEDSNAQNTFDTVINCKDYLLSNEQLDGVVFISQKYHVPRIRLLANRQNIPHSEVLATDRKNVDLENYFLMLIRETLALYKAFLFDF